MVVIRIIFWTWLAISLAIMAYRLVRRIGRRGRRLATSGVGVVASGADGPTAAPPPAAPAEPDPAPAGNRPTTVHTARTGEPPPGTVDPRPPVPAAPLPTTSSPIGDDPTIAEMVSGIALPCGLAPMTGAEPRPGTRESVAFVTTGHTAEAVGEAVTGELERLGFRVHPLADGQVLATRGDAELKATVHGHPRGVAYAGIAAFPMAPTGSVALELWRE